MTKIPPRPFVRANPLQTPRLRLFPIDASDVKELFRAVEESRAHLYPWLPWVPFHRDEAAVRRFVEACAADWDAGRAIRFTIRDRKSNELFGVVGLETCVHIHASCELGYWLCEGVQKRGYMTEAAGAALRAAFQRFGMHRVRVAAATSNHPSLAVIARLGFRFEGIAREAEFCAGRWLDHAQFGMLAGDLEQPK
ncbi:MAG: GNAT family N-acetyltransferase [Polyangiaceae bacterium]|nr:GNAT family N-acetyltransferase [Polyangiaceae bacterium]